MHSSYYPAEVQAMVRSARSSLMRLGVSAKNISVHPVSGSFEIPLLGSALVHTKKVDALIGLGIIVAGKTHHAELIARETARGIMDIQVRGRIPFAFEILYVDSLALAKSRLEKGKEAAEGVVHSLAELKALCH
ncbi:MAG: 6,7-dimethyl-8-ribityllumazine synthase [Candidatus Peregrinibacteria bacterium]